MYQLSQCQYDALKALGIEAWEANSHMPVSDQGDYQLYSLQDTNGHVVGRLLVEACQPEIWSDAMRLVVAMTAAIQLRIRPYQPVEGGRVLILGERLASSLSGVPGTAVVTHSPSALLENPALKKGAWQALKHFNLGLS